MAFLAQILMMIRFDYNLDCPVRPDQTEWVFVNDKMRFDSLVLHWLLSLGDPEGGGNWLVLAMVTQKLSSLGRKETKLHLQYTKVYFKLFFIKLLFKKMIYIYFCARLSTQARQCIALESDETYLPNRFLHN